MRPAAAAAIASVVGPATPRLLSVMESVMSRTTRRSLAASFRVAAENPLVSQEFHVSACLRRSPRVKRKLNGDAPVDVKYEEEVQLASTDVGPVQGFSLENKALANAMTVIRGANVEVKLEADTLAEHPTPSNDTATVPPGKWQEVLETIKSMRSKSSAPVDTMGCEQAGLGLLPKERRFAILVYALLSSQTRDEITHGAVLRLQKANLLNAAAMMSAEGKGISEIIYPVGFYSRKGVYLKKVATVCFELHGGDIPPTFDGLMELPGVGPKMAHLVMNVGWEKSEGICVDTHVHRISNRLRWTGHVKAKSGTMQGTKTPEETRSALQAWLPLEHWVSLNPLLVGFGQTVCRPVRPRCHMCTLSSSGLCPSSTHTTAADTLAPQTPSL